MVSAKNIDFSNVKDGGGRFNRNRLPAGDYLAKISKVEDAEAKDGVFQFLFSIQIAKHPSRILPYYCKLQENQLWKLRNLLIAAGMTVPKRKLKLDPSKVVGKSIGVTLEDDEYDGKEQSSIAAVFPAAELIDGASVEDDDDDDEGGADDEEALDSLDDAADDDEEDEEEADEESADPYADLDRAALKAELKKRDSSFQARKSQSDDDLRDLLRAGDSDAAAAEGEDDEEEDEPEPPKKPAAKKAAAKKKAAEVDDEDLEELDIDDL